jgi:hypothetical protein
MGSVLGSGHLRGTLLGWRNVLRISDVSMAVTLTYSSLVEVSMAQSLLLR